MASDNLMTMEQPWMFRQTSADAWIGDIFTRETDTLAKAMQESVSSNGDAFSNEMIESLLAEPDMAAWFQNPIGSENDATASKQRQASGGKMTKRKSRTSKRATTTFITVDRANFRQKVQQATGVRFRGFNGQLPVLKPEPQRLTNRIQQASTEFFLGGSAAPLMAGGDGDVGIDFDSVFSFPTLESSKVM